MRPSPFCVCAFQDPLWPVSMVARRGPTPSLCPAAMKMTLTLATASPTQEKVNKVTSLLILEESTHKGVN